MSEIWGILESQEHTLAAYSGELLAGLRELAQRQAEPPDVCAVLLATSDSPLPDLASISTLDISHFYVLADPGLAHYATEAYVSALAWLVETRRPVLVTTGATANGRDWMPRLAARLALPFAPGCLSIDIQHDALLALRPIYEGRAYVQTRTELRGHTALATLLTGARGNPVANHQQTNGAQSAPITTLVTASIGSRDAVEHIRHIAMQAPSPEEVELEAAERIVAGGRGVGLEGFAQLASFARLLGAAVGATRVATDHGWVEHARQIGATGKSVHPKLYIACGISGAAQHASGMREAQTVIAINPDRTAPIFALADLGLLGDANQVLPLAAEMIRQDA